MSHSSGHGAAWSGGILGLAQFLFGTLIYSWLHYHDILST